MSFDSDQVLTENIALENLVARVAIDVNTK